MSNQITNRFFKDELTEVLISGDDGTTTRTVLARLMGSFGLVRGRLDNIHEMTRGGGCRLQIELWDFDGNQRHANYSSFSIESTENLYRLRVSGYNGNAGDSLTYSNGHPFSTEDSEYDSSGANCATRYGGSQGWWFRGCAQSYLNGVWMRQSSGSWHGIIWYSWKGFDEPLKETKMKLRCD
ncbi:unnamed protein product [Clavelina lepadiformis]|uniref:Fibrinogen C-terminal domain-containing protein n=1 Tax=Clavelina lepadiformis TaxID=159417 RepID=A0ABP0G4F8_CLALP